MKRLALASAFVLATFTVPAKAQVAFTQEASYSYNTSHWHWRGHQTPIHGVAASTDCGLAARLGGPCGCTVANLLGLPHVYHGINLWLARAWYHFAKTFPHPGAVAIWGHHHVELVSSVHNGRFDSVGSVGHRNVPVSRVAFVQPPR